MHTLTLLEIVKSTLGSMDSDSVDSIGDTVDSEQVALTAKEQFLEMATYQTVPQFETLTQLIGLGDQDQATVMTLPDGTTDIKDVRYRRMDTNGNTFFQEVVNLSKEEFLRMQLSLKVGEDNIGENVMEGNIRVPYRNDKAPTFWTTFDDEHIVFNSIDTVLLGDNTLHNDNSLVLAYIVPPFELTDDFMPPVPLKLFPQYLNMIKEVNSYEQRQISNEVRSRRSERQTSRNRHFGGIADGADKASSATHPTYGRGRQTTGGRGRFR